MKKNLLLFFLSICLFATTTFAQGVCNPAGNIIIYSNYDGGSITINIDENIPDIRIGLCSYEDLHVTITGTYSGNVTQVLYAGYNNDGTTSITGVDPGIVDILNYPPVYLYDPDGYPYMICAYECDTAYVPGGCNTVDQATDYFLTELPGGLRYSYFQYGIWSGTYDMSDGGNCCYSAECFIDIDAGQDLSICVGESATLDVTGALNYDWYDDAGAIPCVDPCSEINVTPVSTTTYTVTGTDADACSGIDSVTVFVYPYPVAEISFVDGALIASGGGTYQWYFEGDIIPGATGESYTPTEDGIYTVLVTSDAGCEDMSDEFEVVVNAVDGYSVEDMMTVCPNPANNITVIHSLTNEPYSLMLTTLAGKILIAENDLSSTTDHAIYTFNIPAGVYILRVTSGSNLSSKQLMICHSN